MITDLIILAGLVLLATIRVVERRADASAAPWFQLASYRRGQIVHLTPMRDGDHVEDEHGECDCNPRSSLFYLDNGRPGTLYIHRILAADQNRSTR